MSKKYVVKKEKKQETVFDAAFRYIPFICVGCALAIILLGFVPTISGSFWGGEQSYFNLFNLAFGSKISGNNVNISYGQINFSFLLVVSMFLPLIATGLGFLIKKPFIDGIAIACFLFTLLMMILSKTLSNASFYDVSNNLLMHKSFTEFDFHLSIGAYLIMVVCFLGANFSLTRLFSRK